MATTLQPRLAKWHFFLVAGVLLVAGSYLLNAIVAHSVALHHTTRGLLIAGNIIACLSVYRILAYDTAKSKWGWVALFLLQALAQVLTFL